MYRLLTVALALTAACGTIVTHEQDVAAPQNYRPPNATNPWRIEGALDTEIHTDKATGIEQVAQRTLKVTIDGKTAIEGPLPTDSRGFSTGTLDGQFAGARIHIDCSSQEKSADWIEIR